MRVVVTGATGNVGTSVVEALSQDPQVDSVLGLARRRPDWGPSKTEWAEADIRSDDLAPHFDGADAVVHLAWMLQPMHRPLTTWRANVDGTRRVLRAIAETGVRALVWASSVGAYSPGPKDRYVAETWPTDGWPTAAYCREKAYVERILDHFEDEHPDCRVVRMRKGFVLRRTSAAEQRRIFIGPLLPTPLVRRELIPLVPDFDGFRLQGLHAADAAEAYRLAVTSSARGAFNLAAEPVIDAKSLGELVGARPVRVPQSLVRLVVAGSWLARLVPSSPYLFDAACRLPLMDSTRARVELGWSPQYSSMDTLAEFFEGLRTEAGMRTPPLRPSLRRRVFSGT